MSTATKKKEKKVLKSALSGQMHKLLWFDAECHATQAEKKKETEGEGGEMGESKFHLTPVARLNCQMALKNIQNRQQTWPSALYKSAERVKKGKKSEGGKEKAKQF